jgi:hypothetical protein
MSPMGTAVIKAPVTELMKSSGTIGGIAATVPHKSKVFKCSLARPEAAER